MYIDSQCRLNSLIALFFFFSKSQNTVTKISKIFENTVTCRSLRFNKTIISEGDYFKN